jgi:hypothetical protein
MWFLKAFFIFACFAGTILAFSFFLRRFAAPVKVYLYHMDRSPLDPQKAGWAIEERKRLKDMESLPKDIRKEQS